VAYVPSSHPDLGELLFVTEGALRAQPFDAGRLTLYDEPITLADNIASFLDGAAFHASDTGVLVYLAGGASAVPFTWYDSEGKVLGPADDPTAVDFSVALSPDGRQGAVTRIDPEGPRCTLAGPGFCTDVWLRDFSRGTSTRFTRSTSAMSAVWSADASRIIFASNREGDYNLYEKPANGAADEQLLLKSNEEIYPNSWSGDGRFLLYTVTSGRAKIKASLRVLPLEGENKPFPLIRPEFNEGDGHFSPDGRWIAYMSDESSRYEIYVRAFDPKSPTRIPLGEGKWLISNNGGTHPRWRGDGRELYYLSPVGQLVSVEISTSPVFRAGVPRPLFQTPDTFTSVSYFVGWDLAADGKRFLFSSHSGEPGQAPFTVVQNWFEEFKRRVPTSK